MSKYFQIISFEVLTVRTRPKMIANIRFEVDQMFSLPFFHSCFQGYLLGEGGDCIECIFGGKLPS